uniref:Uncharacterized protein n=1 Tax=Romanomermis culicivorax TaxID=13658 RepID=A0A915I4W1_ROMCU
MNENPNGSPTLLTASIGRQMAKHTAKTVRHEISNIAKIDKMQIAMRFFIYCYSFISIGIIMNHEGKPKVPSIVETAQNNEAVLFMPKTKKNRNNHTAESNADTTYFEKAKAG